VAGKGGGAWKVAYADFVTAMMAFFLVMWICGQDQSIKRSVSYYFIDPFGSSGIGSKKPHRSGSMSDSPDHGTLPKAESVASGQGRTPYTMRAENSHATKLVSDWLHTDQKSFDYWHEQANRQRKRATKAKEEGDKSSLEKIATQQLAEQLRDEITSGMPFPTGGIYRDLFVESLTTINWTELAEDLLNR
jgi:flagellar motor protein MotB